MVAFLACAAAAYPAGVVYSLRLVAAGDHWLMLAQPSFLLGCLFCLDCFFLFSLLPAGQARRRAVHRAVALAAVIGVMVAAAARIVSYTGMSGGAPKAADVVYLAYGLGMAGFLLDSARWARRGIPHAARPAARGLRLACAGMVLMVAGVIPLTIASAVRITGSATPAALPAAGEVLVLPGIVVFLAGVAYPGTVMRVSAARVWARHRRAYRQLAPLWTVLHEAFPQDALGRLPSSRWREALTPWQAHRRAYRRLIECRDGLVRISPWLGAPDEGDLAGRLLAALRTADLDHLPPRHAVPVAVPRSPGLDADADELVRLSRTIGTARSPDRH